MPEEAERVLLLAAEQEPGDPRVWLRLADLAEARGDDADTAVYLERAIELDPDVPLVQYRVGVVHKRLGNRTRAVFYLEQAAQNFRPGSKGRRKAELEIEQIAAPALEESGLSRSVPEHESVVYARGDRVLWWGQLSGALVPHNPPVEVRWRDPEGEVAHHETVRMDPFGGIEADFDTGGATLGSWTVEVRLGGFTDRRAQLRAGRRARFVTRIPTPRELARLHQSLTPGERVRIELPAPGAAERLRARLHGAGFEAIRRRADALHALRGFTLPDYVGARMRLLLCGLNPSPWSAETGVPFGRPGNRFWPAARAAGLLERDRDPFAALAAGVGFTDLVKRATPGAHELAREEYARGLRRVRALVREWRPGAVCFVGLEGWRAIEDRRARAGWLEHDFEGRPAYLMPSTSGRNAHADLGQLTAHLRSAGGPR